MNFLHTSLFAGLAVAFIPLMIHLLGKREPKQVLLPTLRFVKQTAVQAQRGWTVKRWILLTLRMLLVVAILLALASPRVHNAMLSTVVTIGSLSVLAAVLTAAAFVAWGMRPSGLQIRANNKETSRLSTNKNTRRPFVDSLLLCVLALAALSLWSVAGAWGAMAFSNGFAAPKQVSTGPIAAAIVIDNGPTMDYRFANQSRLEVAKESARWIVQRMPRESQLAILSGGKSQRLSLGPTSANRQIDALQISGRNLDLTSKIKIAIDLVQSTKLARREVYVISDMSVGSWNAQNTGILEASLKLDQPVLIQLVDVGAPKRENWRLCDTRLSQQTVAPGGSLRIESNIVSSRDTPASQANVELWVEDFDATLPLLRNGKLITPKATLRERRTIDLQDDRPAKVFFELRDLQEGTTHAFLKLVRPDPLAIDNTTWFSVEARRNGRTLVLSSDELGSPSYEEARLIALAIDPEQKSVEIKSFSQISKVSWGNFATVALVDPYKLSGESVQTLLKAVREGLGLMLVMGRSVTDTETWNDDPIHQLLPGPVAVQWRRPITDTRYYFVNSQGKHPLWSIFDSAAAEIPWNRFPIYRYWVIDPLKENVSVVAKYALTNHPAIIESTVGKGRIMTFTTPLTQLETNTTALWNRLLANNDAWPTIGLIESSIQYLSSTDQMHRNFLVGQTVVLNNPKDIFPNRYDLFTPDGQVNRMQTENDAITFPYVDLPGIYRLKSAQQEFPLQRGFSVALSSDATDLTPVQVDQLDRILGKDRYSMVKDRNQIQSSIGEARFGRDLTPFLSVLIVLFMIAEQIISHRFYSFGVRTAPVTQIDRPQSIWKGA